MSVAMAYIVALLAAIPAKYHALLTDRAPVSVHQQTATSTLSVLFGGDMMFDRTVRSAMNSHGDERIFSCIDPLLQSQDLVVANLEGPITSSASVSAGSKPGDYFNMIFTFPIQTGALLARHNIMLVNLGNNHILNFGTRGVHSTLAVLKNADVDWFGDPLQYKTAQIRRDGVAVEFINYNEFYGDPRAAASTTIDQIHGARKSGNIPVVYPHWGIEYATTSPQYIRDLARRFVDEGAEIVIGSHPHVVEEREFYRGKNIYYSLGNFVFDQYWDEQVSRGLLLEVTFTSQGVESIREIPISINKDRRVCMVTLI